MDNRKMLSMHPRGYQLMGNAYQHMGHCLRILFVSGLLSACASVTDKTRDIMTLDTQAQSAYQERRCEEAIKLYQELANKLPKHTESLLRIGNCHARNQRYDQAMLAYREAIARDKGYVKAWYNLSYLQATVLGLSLAHMSANIDPSDPSMATIREMAKQLLSIYHNPLQPSGQAAALPTPEQAAPTSPPPSKPTLEATEALDTDVEIVPDNQVSTETSQVP